LLLIGGFYALSSWALVSAWGDDGAVKMATDNPEGMLTETANRYVGSVAGDLVQIFLITSLFAALLSFHNVLARYVFSLGNTAALPSKCGRSHVKHASPHVASAVQTVSALILVVASALAGLDPVTQVFAWFVGISSVGIIALMTLTSVAVVVYFRRSKTDTRIWHTLVAPGLGLVGLAILLVMTAINLPLLVGGSSTTAAVIGVLLVGTFAAGAVLAALRPRAGRPSTEKEYTR
jgi:amino acid transporter